MNLEIYKPLVSIVVTTRNEQENIKNCLSAIINSNYDNCEIEVIVVDNFSNDETSRIVEKFPEVYFYTIGPERNAQRNFGLLNKAKGDYYFWIDADHIIHPELIQSCVNAMKSDLKLVALTIPEVILGNSLFSKIRRYERFFYESTVIDGSRFIKSDAFHEVKGFSSLWQHGPDDWDLDIRLSNIGKIGHLKASQYQINSMFQKFISKEFLLDTNLFDIAMYHNESKLTLKRHILKKIHYGKDFAEYIKFHGKNHPAVKKQMSPFYRCIYVFIENKKWKLALKKPELVIGAILIKIMIGTIYFFKYTKKKC